MPRLTGILLLTVALWAAALTAHAAEIGHFNGGILNIRDYFVPEPGPVSYTHLTLPTIYSV